MTRLLEKSFLVLIVTFVFGLAGCNSKSSSEEAGTESAGLSTAAAVEATLQRARAAASQSGESLDDLQKKYADMERESSNRKKRNARRKARYDRDRRIAAASPRDLIEIYAENRPAKTVIPANSADAPAFSTAKTYRSEFECNSERRQFYSIGIEYLKTCPPT